METLTNILKQYTYKKNGISSHSFLISNFKTMRLFILLVLTFYLCASEASIPARLELLDDDFLRDTDSYLVLLKPNVDEKIISFHSRFIETFALTDSNSNPDSDAPTPRWFSLGKEDEVVLGYSAKLDLHTLLVLSRDPSVELIERDKPVQIWEEKIEHDAPWGLARSCHRDRPDSRDFIYDEDGGENVDVYVIDTGVYIEHEDFEDRATFGKSFVRDRKSDEEIRKDDNGHGTHCAGIIAGKKYGMCKQCHIIAVKVLDRGGSGTMSDVIAGIEWAVNNVADSNKKSVISMSLGGGFSEIMNRAVDSATSRGIHVVVASGNSRDDTCDYSPASAETVVSVGATDSLDNMAEFSNYGNCTHIFAPGVQIDSTWINGPDSHSALSGTSMAAPHVSGAIGSLLSKPEYADLSPKEMREKLQKIATKNIIKDIPKDLDSPNLLLYNGVIERKEEEEDISTDIEDVVEEECLVDSVQDDLPEENEHNLYESMMEQLRALLVQNV